MAARNRILATGAASLALMGLAACGNDAATPAASATASASQDECITIAEGLYVFENGKFTATAPQPVRATVSTPVPPAAWSTDLARTFPGLGFPWMGLSVRENVATLTGLAPDKDASERGFEAGEAAVTSHPIGAQEITLVVDGIGIDGGERGVGESLATLSQGTLSPEACQQAFTDTMQGQTIRFETNRALVSPVSIPLMDAISGIAMLCEAYGIEIGGHTDSRGSDEYNQVLSQRRADTVRQFLLEKGVATDRLTAVGYGESMPLVPVDDEDAWGRNSRIEFRITGN